MSDISSKNTMEKYKLRYVIAVIGPSTKWDCAVLPPPTLSHPHSLCTCFIHYRLSQGLMLLKNLLDVVWSEDIKAHLCVWKANFAAAWSLFTSRHACHQDGGRIATQTPVIKARVALYVNQR